MSDLNPNTVYNDYKKEKIDKTTISNMLISIIENPPENYPITTDKAFHIRKGREIRYRDEALRILGEIGIKNDEIFKLLESIVISQESGLSFNNAVKILIQNFPDRCIQPLKWIARNYRFDRELTFIFDLIWWSDNPLFSELKRDLLKSLQERIRKYTDKGVIFDEAIVLALIESPVSVFEKIDYNQDTEEILNYRELYYFYKTNKEGHVTEIHAAPYGFSYIPKNISKLKYLKVFRSIGEELFEIPESIGQLQCLEALVLLGTRLNYLPESIGDLKNLKKLVVALNNLQSLPNSIGGLKNLVELDASNNKIEEIPESFGNLEMLKILNLGGNKIEYILHSLLNLKNLEILNLSGNKIKNDSDSIQSLKSITKLIL